MVLVCSALEMISAVTVTRKDINPEDWPRCGRCSLPVEDFYVLLSGDVDITFVACCHGKEEIISVPLSSIEDASTVTIGTAFGEENYV